MQILIIHKVHKTLQQQLISSGFKVDTILNLSREDIIKILPQYDGLVVRSALKVDREVIAAASKLKFIARLGAGLENIDTLYAAEKGIEVFGAPEGNRSAVGEHSLGMLLNLFNKINIADAQVRKGIWQREENRGEEVEGKTIGIIGYGNMGSAFAKRLCGFEANIIAYDKYKVGFQNEFVEEVSLDVLFERADIVSLHVPLQDDTFHMFNMEFIQSFKKNIVLINTSRGAVVETSALVEGLKNSKIIGACLDVLEFEGMSFEDIEQQETSSDFVFLSNAENVILSPHIAGWTHQSNEKMANILAAKIILYLQNK